jgi:hypothetical protein
MTCYRAQDRSVLLSQGLFGAPASQTKRDRETFAAERARRPQSLSSRDD